MKVYSPKPFPFSDNIELIAPYWADVDTDLGGDIWYRESVNTTLLKVSSYEVKKQLPELYKFQASWLFIATWADVPYYGANSNGTTKVIDLCWIILRYKEDTN